MLEAIIPEKVLVNSHVLQQSHVNRLIFVNPNAKDQRSGSASACSQSVSERVLVSM